MGLIQGINDHLLKTIMREIAPAGIVHCFCEIILFYFGGEIVGSKNEKMKIIRTYFMHITVELDLWVKKLTVPIGWRKGCLWC